MQQPTFLQVVEFDKFILLIYDEHSVSMMKHALKSKPAKGQGLGIIFPLVFPLQSHIFAMQKLLPIIYFLVTMNTQSKLSNS